jgi:hypothetical protein
LKQVVPTLIRIPRLDINGIPQAKRGNERAFVLLGAKHNWAQSFRA